jgi:hypothetical protein
MRFLTSWSSSFLVKDGKGSFNVIDALFLCSCLGVDPCEVQVGLMKFKNIAQQYAALKFINDVVKGEIVLTDIQSVDPAHQQVLLKGAYINFG